MSDVRTVTIGAVEREITESDTVATLFERIDGPLEATPQNTQLCRPYSHPETRPPREDEVISFGLDELEDGDDLELYRVRKADRPAYERELATDGGTPAYGSIGDVFSEGTDETSALTFDDPEWSTTYEVSSGELSRFFDMLQRIRETAIVEFQPDRIAGVTVGTSDVGMCQSRIGESCIKETGSHCAVAVDVESISIQDSWFLNSTRDATVTIDRDGEEMELSNGNRTETVGIYPVSHHESQVRTLPEVDYSTKARLEGWQFTGAVKGALGATEVGIQIGAVEGSDLRVSPRDTDWEKVIEDVVTETDGGSSLFSTWFLPDIFEGIPVGADVEVRCGDYVPLEVEIDEHTTFAIAPQEPPEDQGDAA